MSARRGLQGVIPNGAVVALCAWGWHVWNGSDLQPVAYGCAAVGAVAGLNGLAALTNNAHEIHNTLRSTRPHSSHGGAASFMTIKEAEKAGLCSGEGVILGTKDGKLLTDSKSVHAVYFSPSGRGKTTKSVIPNAARCMESGDWDIVITVDPKPELCVMLKGLCDKRKYQFYNINTSGRYEELVGPSARFNQCELIIRHAAQGRRGLLETCTSLNAQLIKIDRKGEDKNIWWKRGGGIRITLLQAYFALTDPGRCNYPDILAILEDPLAFEALLDEIAAREDILQGDLARMARSIIALSVADPKNHATMIDEAITALQMFRQSGAIAPVCKDTNIDFSQPAMIVLSTDMNRVETQRQLTGLNILSIMRLVADMDRPLRVKVIYDEAAFAPMDNLNDMLVIARGAGVSFELYYQSEADARRVLGDEGFRSMMANCERKVWFGLTDGAEELSKTLGEVSTLKESWRSDGNDGMGVNRSHERERLMSAHEIRQLEIGTGMAQIGNLKPVLFRTLSYAEIDPYKREIRHSPLEKGPLKLKTRVWLKK